MNAVQPSSSGHEADIVKAAADWHVRHEIGLTPQEQTEFAAWLATSPGHAAAWRDVNATLFAFAQVRAEGQAADFVAELARRRRQKRWRLITGSALGLAAAIALLFWVRPATPPPREGEMPVIVRTAEQVLPDGSRVELNAGAEIAVNYTAARREVRLVRGEAIFTVVKNPAKPFVVVSGNIEVRAVGTVFAVQLGAQAVDVLVTEGRVAVATAIPSTGATVSTPDGATAPPVFVDAGDQLVLPAAGSAAGQSRPISATEINRRLAWRQPRLQLSGTTLADAAELLNRENLMQIEIADPELGRLRLTGFFYLDDTRGFVHVLEANYGVQVERQPSGTVVLRSR